MDFRDAHIALPLDAFLQRLELAGFAVSPAQRMQLLRVLQVFGRDYLRDIDQLKYRLCPIVARSEEEQKRFYELFDQYLEEVKPADWTPPEKEVKPHWYDRVPLWVWALLLPLFLVFLVLLIPPDPPPPPVVQFEHPAKVQIGQTVDFKNKSIRYDSLRVQYEWQLVNAENDSVEQTALLKDWRLTIPNPGQNFFKRILLIAADEKAGRRDTASSPLTIVCLKTEPIDAPEQAELDALVSFQTLSDTIGDLSYFWDFGDGEQGRGKEIQHRFRRSGTYEVQLRIERRLIDDTCVQELEHRINIGQEKAFLATTHLEKDELNTLLNFSLGTWILLGILGVLIIYYWMKWLVSMPPPDSEEEKRANEALLSLGLPDRGPYFIPFRNRNGLIRLSPSMFRLANILRQRQEGFRKVLDVPGSIRATMASGGFPSLQMANTTVPSEYLFLIDEQAAGSHQSKLYHYLFEFLRSKDVHVTAYRYDTILNRFWNDATPEGLSPDQLYRLYPNYRLMILGDARALLHSHLPAGPAVKENYAEFIRSWKNGLLLTPVPVVSWNAQEAALYRILPVFPGDIDGFQSAMAALELALDEEEAPREPFEQWRAQLLREHSQPDVNYRRWNRPNTYKSYLKDHPQLYRWLCALAVYPDPDWAITIAVGRALEPLGVEVTFDNLRILGQVPWLRGEAFPPKLRFALLRELDEETERLARQATVKELNAVAHLVTNSHAGLELQTNLAVQQFTLDPQDPAYQDSLRQLQAKGWLNNKQQAELNQALSRREDISQSNFEEYLAETEKAEEKPDKPEKPALTFNHYFYKALSYSLLFVILWVVIWVLDGTNRFYDTILPDSPRSISADSLHSLRDYFFVEENTYIDSAIIYNNAGVDAWRESELNEEEKSRIEKGESGDSEKAIALFQKAYEYRRWSPYQLAALNLAKARYNQGVLTLNQYLERFESIDELSAARQNFQLAAAMEAVRPNARHGAGLTHYYQQSLDSAAYYRRLLDETGFFDTLSLYPNLKSLLGDTSLCAGPEIRFSIAANLCAGSSASLRNETTQTQNDILYYIINWGDGSRDSVADFTAISHRFVKPGDYPLRASAYYRCPDGSLTQTQWSRSLGVSQAVRAAFDVSTNEGCAPLPVTFINRSTNSREYEWDFGGLKTDRSAKSSRFVFEKPGQYTIRLRALGACGQNEATRTITVLPASDCEETVAAKKATWQGEFDVQLDYGASLKAIASVEYEDRGYSGRVYIEDLLRSVLQKSLQDKQLSLEDIAEKNRLNLREEIKKSIDAQLESNNIKILDLSLRWRIVDDVKQEVPPKQDTPNKGQAPTATTAALLEAMPAAFYFDIGAPRQTYKASYAQLYRTYYAKKKDFLAQFKGPDQQAMEFFFENELKGSMDQFAVFRDQLVAYLQTDQRATIELIACLDTDALYSNANDANQSVAFDEALASRRIDSVIEMFKQDKELRGFIDSKQLQFTISQTECDLPRQQQQQQQQQSKIPTPPASIYSLEAALSRRVEFRIK